VYSVRRVAKNTAPAVVFSPACRTWRLSLLCRLKRQSCRDELVSLLLGNSTKIQTNNYCHHNIRPNYYYHHHHHCYYTRLRASFPGQPRSHYQKGKTSLELNEARDDGVLGCSWTICTHSAPRSRQITTTPHRSIFLRTGCSP